MIVFGGFHGPGAIRCEDSAKRHMSSYRFKMHCHEIHVRLQTSHFIARYEFHRYNPHEVVLAIPNYRVAHADEVQNVLQTFLDPGHDEIGIHLIVRSSSQPVLEFSLHRVTRLM